MTCHFVVRSLLVLLVKCAEMISALRGTNAWCIFESIRVAWSLEIGSSVSESEMWSQLRQCGAASSRPRSPLVPVYLREGMQEPAQPKLALMLDDPP